MQGACLKKMCMGVASVHAYALLCAQKQQHAEINKMDELIQHGLKIADANSCCFHS